LEPPHRIIIVIDAVHTMDLPSGRALPLPLKFCIHWLDFRG